MRGLVLVVLALAAIAVFAQRPKSSPFRTCLLKCKGKGVRPLDCFEACENLLEQVDELSEVFSSSQKPTTTAKPFVPLDGKKIWESYTTELFRFIKRGVADSKPTLQILKDPLVATWDNDAKQLNDMCNSISKVGSIVYTPIQGASVPTEYGKFLHNLKVSKPSSSANSAKSERLKEVKEEMENLRSSIAKLDEKCETNYQNMKKIMPSLDKDEYTRTRCTTMIRQKERLAGYEYTHDSLKKEVAGPDAEKVEAIADFDAEKSFEWKEFWGTLAEMKQKVREGKGTTLGISVAQKAKASSLTSEYSEVSFGNSTSFVNSAPSTTTIKTEEYKLKTSADNFKVEIVAPSYAAIRVSPKGKWFHNDIVSSNKNGPFIDAAKNTIGPKKSLPWLLQTLHVVHQPSMSLYLDEADAKHFASLKGTTKTIKIGPFTCNTSNITVEKTDEEDVQKVTFTTNAEAYVIAVDHGML